MRSALVVCTLLLGAAGSSSAQAQCVGKFGPPGSFTRTIVSDGITRTFMLDVPADYDPTVPTPVVFNFHGWTMTAASQAAYTDMPARGTSAGFIVVHPDGLYRSWNAGTCCGGAVKNDIDDVGFTLDMLALLNTEYCVDPKRVHSTGFSNGGYMSHRLACELPDVFASVAPVSGLIGVPCTPVRPIAVHQSQGETDKLVWYRFAQEDIAEWAALNRCDPTPVTYYEAGDVSCLTYPNCMDGVAVDLCSIANTGHEWVDEDWYHTTDENLAFFREYVMP